MGMRPSGLAEKQNLEGPGAAASFARRIHVSRETEDAIFSTGGLRVSLVQAQGPAAACG